MAATIKDVAAKAGTSTATVSKVMNGSYSISQATIDRVNEAIKELDYHPNMRARNFVKQATRTIIFVATIDKNAGFDNPHMFEIMSGLEHVLSEHNYSLIMRSINQENVCEYIKSSSDMGIADGFVIHASVLSEELDKLVYTENIPHIVIGNPDFISHLSWIDIDNRLAGEMAAKHLLEQGYQSLAFVGGTERDKISMHRLTGVKSILDEHDIIIPKSYVQCGESECDSGYKMTCEILDNSKRPDAIICANNYIAYGCMNALRDNSIKCPQEIGVVTFDDFPFSRVLKPKLTVVNIDVYDMGIQAGKYIIQKIRKPNLHVQSFITFPELIERESSIR